jgi:SPP1 family predicted phage head-tail adaptor
MTKPIKKDAGQLRHRVTIEDLSVTQDNIGIITESWQEVATVWAEIRPMSGREFIAANAIQAGVTTKITIRHMDGINAKMRVRHKDTLYNIKAVLPDITLAGYLMLMVEDGVNAG